MTPPPRRRGVVLVDEEDLVRLLRLPAAWRVLAFQPFPVRMSIGVLVEGPDLPECELGTEPSFVEPPAPPAAAPAAPRVDEVRVAEAIAAVAAECHHPDAGGPIYQPVRPCVACAAAAVMVLLRRP